MPTHYNNNPGPFRLQPQRRRRIRRRAEQRADRQMRVPERKAQRQIGRTQRQTGRRASRARQSALSEQRRLNSVDMRGLSGRYLREAQQAVQLSQNQLGRAAQVVPRSIQRQGRRQVRGIRQDLVDQRQGQVQQNMGQMVEQARNQLREQAGEQAQGGQRQANVQDALKAAGNLYATAVEERDVPRTDREWTMFAWHLQGQDPLANPAAIERAVAQLRARIEARSVRPRPTSPLAAERQAAQHRIIRGFGR